MRIHLIPNSHIDPVWLWDQYEGIDEVLNTFRSACDRLDEFPDLTFTASSLQLFSWLLDYDPQLFDRVARFVKAGRWEIVGDWWVEADTNLPGRASLRKQSQIARAFAKEHFGCSSSVAFLPDTFGHPADLPQVLQETGYKYLIFCRPDLSEKPDLPGDLFYWTYRGHRVLAYRLRHHYFQEDTTDEMRLARVTDPEYSHHKTNAFLFGLGDHGGGPTILEIEYFKQFADSQPIGDVGFSSCARFFAEAEQRESIPTYSGDLHMHAVGCYSVVRDLKQLVRSGEAALMQASRAEDMATGTNDSFESAEHLGPAWRTLLFNQFHDILPGSLSPDAADHARQELGSVHQAARAATYASMKKLSLDERPAIREGEFRMFNTLPHPITVPLSVQSFLYFREGAAFRDADMKQIAIQEVPPDVRCGSHRWVFVDTLPAQGFKSYHFDGATTMRATLPKDRHFVKGGFPDHADASRVPWMPGLRMRFVTIDDESDTWGHGVASFGDGTPVSSLVGESHASGVVLDSVFRQFESGKSEIDVVFSRYAELDGIYLDIRVRWSEKRQILKLEFDRDGLLFDQIEMQGAVGSIWRRADGTEQPMHRWIRIPGKRVGVGPAADPDDLSSKNLSAAMGENDSGFIVVQDGSFACDARNSKFRITLVRSSVYAYDKKTALHPNDPERYTDTGEHHFVMRLLNDNGLDEALLNRTVDEFVERIPVIRETP